MTQKYQGGARSRHIIYDSPAGPAGCESINAREEREKFWRSLRKQVSSHPLNVKNTISY